MAGVAYITGTKVVLGTETDFAAVGTVQDGGWWYFNDNEFYRYREDIKCLQVHYEQRDRWVNSNAIQGIKITAFDPANINAGGGAVAPSQDIEGMVQWAIDIANDASHGYDQTYRTGPDYDCSSLIYSAANAAGFDVGMGSTRTMRADFTAKGWVWTPGGGNEVSTLQRGDILLDESSHVEMYIGQMQNVGAHSNEFGGITGGQTGDQTGREISVGPYYSKPWDGMLRYGG